MRVFIQIRNREMAWINADHIISVWRNIHSGEATLKIVGYDSNEYSVLPYEEVQKLLLGEMLNDVGSARASGARPLAAALLAGK